ncbi:MAG: ABC transporter substrate-binding protein [Lachnospiraceae bacterium]|nr:ABC transporter substrate-binding protein [Lachnospiraceae bacterium]
MNQKLRVLFAAVLLVCTMIFMSGCAADSGKSGKSTEEDRTAENGAEGNSLQEGNAGETTYPLEVTDAFGNKVTIEKEPERVVSLSPANTEILFALGAGERVKGRTDYCSYPQEVSKVQSVGTYTSPNTELIISMEPDVILVSDAIDESIKQQVEAAGAKVVVFSANSVESTKDCILTIGKILNLNQKAAEITGHMESELKAIQEKVASVQKKKTVFVDLGSYYSAGPGSLLDDMINQLGAVNMIADASETWPQISLETIMEKNPDVYLSLYTSPEELKNTEGLKELDCIKNDHIIFYEALSADGDIVQRPGPRLIEGIRMLAEKIYPDLF